ncbi:hypothetical protein A3K80_00260 [Candidatus Bathyarchaeota archaeon RBG_13_38_9]|nr:MAG: hypothetical protein A3K80_00260 [Candidatus Bathyarchaeota archaeon RBG_13_38_9]
MFHADKSNLLKVGISVSIIFVCILALNIGEVSGAFPGAKGKIVYMGQDGDPTPDYEIYTMNPDGSNITKLTDDDVYDANPAWSKNGSKIAFVSTRNIDGGNPEGDEEIWIMNPDGTGKTQLTFNSANDREPDWSPWGDRIVFSSNRDGDYEIYVMDTDGTKVKQLTNNTSSADGKPSWSPLGDKIVFYGYDGDHEIFVMDVNGISITQLTNNVVSDIWPDWSPDGSKIAFVRDWDPNGDIYLMEPDGANQTQITFDGKRNHWPAWSPDGKRISYVSTVDGDYEIYSMNADGSNVTQLTANVGSYDAEPDWQPTAHELIIVPDDFSTIQEAIYYAWDGDMIFVRSGIYNELIRIDKAISLIGEERDTTIITGLNEGTVVSIGDNASISQFTIQSSSVMSGGISVNRANNIMILNNTIKNHRTGISLYYSSNLTLRNNNINNSKFDLSINGRSLSDFLHDIDTSNKINGNSIYYLVNQTDLTVNSVSHPDLGYLGIVNSKNITVTGLNITNNYEGILLAFSNNSIVNKVNLTDNRNGFHIVRCNGIEIFNSSVTWSNANGFYIDNCTYLTIKDNLIANNSFYGIRIEYAGNNLVKNNTIDNNADAGISIAVSSGNVVTDNFIVMGHQFEDYGHGITLATANNNIIQRNYIGLQKWVGLLIQHSDNNNIIENTVTSNGVGIFLESSNSNKIYHNNFIDNTNQTYVSDSMNIWNQSYPSGGNYWSNYTGVDLNKGVNQNLLGSDGIGDTPYIIDGNNKDNYPLMNPWETFVISDIASDVIDANENTVYFIYPDYQGVKPPGVKYAMLSDWTAAGYIVGMCSNRQYEVTDTNSSIVDSSDGSLKLSNETVVLFGGPVVNAPVNYYEKNRIAPLYFNNAGGVLYWHLANGTRLDDTAMTFSELETGNDMFVVEAFKDSSGNSIFIVYGYEWKGTFAGGKFFKFVIYPDISSYTDSFYVFRWTDSNGNDFADLNEIDPSPVASG